MWMNIFSVLVNLLCVRNQRKRYGLISLKCRCSFWSDVECWCFHAFISWFVCLAARRLSWLLRATLNLMSSIRYTVLKVCWTDGRSSD